MSALEAWMTVDELVERLVFRQHGLSDVSPRAIFLEQSQGKLSGRFKNPVLSVRQEIHRKLAAGTLVAFGELKSVAVGLPTHRQIEPIEWATLSLNCKGPGAPFVRFRVKSKDVEQTWPISKFAGASTDVPVDEFEPSDVKSPFKRAVARRIFSSYGGWPKLSQGRAAGELRREFEKELEALKLPSESDIKLPSETTCEGWIRLWSDKYGITRQPRP